MIIVEIIAQLHICSVNVVKKAILDLNPLFMSRKRTTKTNHVFKNVKAHSGFDPKDDNMINLLLLSVGNIEDRSSIESEMNSGGKGVEPST